MAGKELPVVSAMYPTTCFSPHIGGMRSATTHADRCVGWWENCWSCNRYVYPTGISQAASISVFSSPDLFCFINYMHYWQQDVQAPCFFCSCRNVRGGLFLDSLLLLDLTRVSPDKNCLGAHRTAEVYSWLEPATDTMLLHTHGYILFTHLFFFNNLATVLDCFDFNPRFQLCDLAHPFCQAPF